MLERRRLLHQLLSGGRGGGRHGRQSLSLDALWRKRGRALFALRLLIIWRDSLRIRRLRLHLVTLERNEAITLARDRKVALAAAIDHGLAVAARCILP